MRKAKPTSIQIPEDIMRRLQAHKDNSVTSQLLTAYRILEKIRFYSTQELRSKFSSDEWKLLADALRANTFTMEAHYTPQEIVTSLEEQDLYHAIGNDYGVNVETLCNKISKLSAGQLDALYTRLQTFWDVSDEYEDKDPDDYESFLERWSKF